jgi:hypothetical protein
MIRAGWQRDLDDFNAGRLPNDPDLRAMIERNVARYGQPLMPEEPKP